MGLDCLFHPQAYIIYSTSFQPCPSCTCGSTLQHAPKTGTLRYCRSVCSVEATYSLESSSPIKALACLHPHFLIIFLPPQSAVFLELCVGCFHCWIRAHYWLPHSQLFSAISSLLILSCLEVYSNSKFHSLASLLSILLHSRESFDFAVILCTFLLLHSYIAS